MRLNSLNGNGSVVNAINFTLTFKDPIMKYLKDILSMFDQKSNVKGGDRVNLACPFGGSEKVDGYVLGYNSKSTVMVEWPKNGMSEESVHKLCVTS